MFLSALHPHLALRALQTPQARAQIQSLIPSLVLIHARHALLPIRAHVHVHFHDHSLGPLQDAAIPATVGHPVPGVAAPAL